MKGYPSDKKVREGWMAAQFCLFQCWPDAIIDQPTDERGTDVIIRYARHEYHFQMTEIHPLSPDIKKISPVIGKRSFDDHSVMSGSYGDQKSEVLKMVEHIVGLKEKKRYANPEKMNLLVYLRSPRVSIDPELDLDLVTLRQQYAETSFGSICLLTEHGMLETGHGRIDFVKGDGLVGVSCAR